MNRRHQIPLFLALFAAVLLAAASSSAQKPAGEKAIEEYQNRQRVLSLVQYENRIKALEDAPMRCAARFNIATFIYETGLKDLFAYAEDHAESCLRETSVSSSEFISSRAQIIRSSFYTLLRKHSPEKAKSLEEKYPVEGFAADLADNREIHEAEDVGPAAERIIAKIRAGEITPMTRSSLSALRRKNPKLADKGLEAFVTYYETRSVLTEADKLLAAFGMLFADPSVPKPIRERYLRMSLNFGRRALNEPGNEALYNAAVPNLRTCFEQFEKHLPEALGEARSIVAAIEGNRARAETEKDAALKRIAESEDKLEQILSEIESAKDPELKKILIRQGASLALYEKKFKLAVDLALRYEDDGEGFSWREFHLKSMVPGAALREDNVEAVEYAIEAISDPLDKADSTLRIVTYFQTRKKNDENAVAYLDRALEFIDRAEPSARALSILWRAAALSRRFERYDIFAMAGKAVKMINSLPMEDPEKASDPESHSEFVMNTLYGAGNSAAVIFDAVCEKDPEAGYPYVQSIQRRDIRLMAEISYEKSKRYPLPADEEQKQDEQDR